MYAGVSPQAYDRAITVFSPDGRLFQVEYAKEAVKRGATAAGLVCKDGVVLVASKNNMSRLLVPKSMKKIFEIDEHIATTASGLIADARKLIDAGRLEAQRHKLKYGESIQVETLAKNLCDTMQAYTQIGGVRPFGVSLLIAGIDTKPRLFETEPSGALTEYLADAIGSSKKEVCDFFEKKYDEGMSVKQGIELALVALKKSGDIKKGAKTIEVSYSKADKKKFISLNEKEIKEYLERI